MAADSLKVTAQALAKTGIVDEVVKEPRGGAHRDPARAAEFLGQAIARHLSELRSMNLDEILENRYRKFRQIGAF